MKMMYKMVFFFICLNMATYLVDYACGLTGFPTENVNPVINPTDLTQDFNATKTVETWSSYTGSFTYIGDVVGGLVMMWKVIITFFVGFPMFLQNIGVPTVIVNILYAIESFIFTWAVFEWISGRRASS